ncbi:MAG: GSCFA domain-containing protein, partial [Bacteroidia bacterium]|nr:GSCFA domain-containing protein [Bacteroidia bacterium]
MKFQLDFSFSSHQKISCKDQVTLLGSCFAESIGEKFERNKFHSLTNPYGIIFNPLSLATCISEIISEKKYSENELIQQNGLWHSFQHHGSFSFPDKNSALQKINSEIERAAVALKKPGWLIVTFGSAFVYTHTKTERTVANCHKIPGTEFEKKLLTTAEIVAAWKEQLASLKKFNPYLKILFTVSPVRYLRDGLIENNISKSTLLLAVHELCKDHNTVYFPAYELVNDVLRDYRFFKEDMVHPTQQAVDFVWQKFSDAMLDEESKSALKEV